MTTRDFPHIKKPAPFRDLVDWFTWACHLFEVVSTMRRGKMDCTTEITLTPSAASSTLNDIRLSPYSVVLFDPQTANAAAEKAAGTMYVTTANRGNNAWTITHANNAQADRLFRVLILA